MGADATTSPSPTPKPTQKPPRDTGGTLDMFKQQQQASAAPMASGAPKTSGEITVQGTGVPLEHQGDVWLHKPGAPKGDVVSYNTGTVGQDYAANNKQGPTYNAWVSKSDAMNAFKLLSTDDQRMFADIAKARGNRATAESVYKRYVTIASLYSKNGIQKSPAELALAEVTSGNSAAFSSGSGSSGGYSGPVTTTSTSFMDRDAAAMLLNKLATDKLGRNLTDQELKQYTAEFHKREAANPTVTTTGKTSQTSQLGMADDDIANKILMQNPAFSDNVLKTDVVDMFFNRIGGKNGGQ